MATAGAASTASEVVPPLDPWQTCAKKNAKNSKECTEVYLAKRGSNELSDNFKFFENLEVVWFNGNRLARLENLSTNFRIREVYAQDNRLVSLAGITTFKFLKVLLASNNQLRNLEKQLDLLEKFNFLKKLDLFGNPCAEEPDYRLRLIYQCPQVEILDRRIIRDPERIKADEVVPNLDKASAPKPEPTRKKGDKLSTCERDLYAATKNIQVAKKRKEDEALGLGQTFVKTMSDNHYRMGMLNEERTGFRALRANPRELWKEGGEYRGKAAPTSSASAIDASKPSNYEKLEMRLHIEKAAKTVAVDGGDGSELTREDVLRLAEVMSTKGVEEVARVLGDAAVPPDRLNASKTSSSSFGGKQFWAFSDAFSARQKDEDPAALQRRLQFFRGEADPDAKMPIGQVTEWLLQKPWPHAGTEHLEARIGQMHEDQKWSHLGRNYEALHAMVTEARKVVPAGVSKEEIEVRRARNVSAAYFSSQGVHSKGENLTLFEAVALPHRLEGIRSSNQEVRVSDSLQDSGGMRKHRSDVFKQNFLTAQRGALSESTLKMGTAEKLAPHPRQKRLDRVGMTIQVTQGGKMTTLGG